MSGTHRHRALPSLDVLTQARRTMPFFPVFGRDGVFPACGGSVGSAALNGASGWRCALHGASPLRGFVLLPRLVNALRCPVYIINLSAVLADTFIELPIMTPKYFPRRIVQFRGQRAGGNAHEAE